MRGHFEKVLLKVMSRSGKNLITVNVNKNYVHKVPFELCNPMGHYHTPSYVVRPVYGKTKRGISHSCLYIKLKFSTAIYLSLFYKKKNIFHFFPKTNKDGNLLNIYLFILWCSFDCENLIQPLGSLSLHHFMQ